MGNRKQPFGYMIVQGKITINPQEAELVEYIFKQYIQGMSFQALAQTLNEQPIPYEAEKLWNKNMVARILEDRRYQGAEKYPKIISPENMDLVAQKRTVKRQPCHKTEAQKLLRQLSGHPPTEHMEQQVLSVMNSLIKSPERICTVGSVDSNAGEIARLQKALDNELLRQPIDEEKAKNLIFTIAAVQYGAIDSEKYETQRLQRVFSKASPTKELDAGLMRSTILAIKIDSKASLTVVLKNKQEIGCEF